MNAQGMLARSTARRLWVSSWVALLAIGALIATRVGADEGSEAGYLIQNVRISEFNDGEAVVLADIGWEGSGRPRLASCSWRVFDGDGKEVGSLDENIISMDDAIVQGMQRTVPLTLGTEPTRAEGRCSPPAPGDGDGAYEVVVGSVEYPLVSPVGLEEDAVAVHYSVRWMGNASPEARACVVSVQDEEGRFLLKHEVTLLALEPAEGRVLTVPASEGMSDRRPDSATITCET